MVIKRKKLFWRHIKVIIQNITKSRLYYNVPIQYHS